MKGRLFVFLTTVFCIAGNAQDIGYDWAKQISSSIGSDIVVDTDGGIYCVGNFSHNIDLDPGPGIDSAFGGAYRFYISKLDRNGNYAWGGAISAEVEDNNIVIDSFNNIYITGTFEGTVDFDLGSGVTNLSAKGAKDVFICKYNASGALLWAKQFGGLSFTVTTVKNIALDGAGNIITMGEFGNVTDFNPANANYPLGPFGRSNFFLSKLTKDGIFVWARQIASYEYSNGLENFGVDSIGNIYVGFKTEEDSVNFQPPSFTYSYTSTNPVVYLVKYAPTGQVAWVKHFDLPVGYMSVSHVVVSSKGIIGMIGVCNGAVDFDPDSGVVNTTTYFNGAFFAMFDTIGSLLWVKKIESSSVNVNDVILDASNELYFCGSFYGNADFDPSSNYHLVASTTILPSGHNAYLCKLDMQGNLVYVKILESNQEGEMNAIAKSADDHVIGTGGHRTTTDFNPGAGVALLNSYETASFILKLKPCIATRSSRTITACEYYIAPSGAEIFTSGIYYDTIGNSVNCDSIITIDVTIIRLEPTIRVNDNVLTSSINPYGNYQWINCNGNLPIAGAIGMTYTAPINGSYAVVMESGTCKDTSICRVINTFVNVVEIHEEANLVAYPNPTNHTVSVELPKYFNEINVKVFDALGSELAVNVVRETNSLNIDLSSTTKGIYFIIIEALEHPPVIVKIVKW